MTQVCCLDFETTGVDPKTAVPLELAAIMLQCSEVEQWKPGATYHKFFLPHDLTEVPAHITELTGITLLQLQKFGKSPDNVLSDFLEFSRGANYFMAHNKTYDLNVFNEALLRYLPRAHEWFSGHPILDSSKWICSLNDVPYPARFRCKILSHIALDHGVYPREGEKAHSAMTDVYLVGRTLAAGGYTLERILQYRDEPYVYLQALVPPPWQDGKKGVNEAKAAGYGYESCRGTDSPTFPKCWVKRCKQSEFDAEKAIQLPFKRQILEC